MTNLGPDSWGPHAWKFIHIVALAYPIVPTTEEQLTYKHFFTIIGDIIPCNICREHYKQHLKNNPITDDILSTRKKLLHWTIDIHNEVNKLNNKPVYDYDTAIELITRNYECSPVLPKKNQIIDPIINPIINNNENDNIVVNKTKNTKIIEEITINNNKYKYIFIFLLIVVIVMFLYFDNKKKNIYNN